MYIPGYMRGLALPGGIYPGYERFSSPGWVYTGVYERFSLPGWVYTRVMRGLASLGGYTPGM